MAASIKLKPCSHKAISRFGKRTVTAEIDQQHPDRFFVRIGFDYWCWIKRDNDPNFTILEVSL